MELTADQSDYGPCEGLTGARGVTDGAECVSASGDGGGGQGGRYLASRPLTVPGGL